MEELINAISTVGFPIAGCVGLFYLYNTIIKDVVTSLNDVKSTLANLNETLQDVRDMIEKH